MTDLSLATRSARAFEPEAIAAPTTHPRDVFLPASSRQPRLAGVGMAQIPAGTPRSSEALDRGSR